MPYKDFLRWEYFGNSILRNAQMHKLEDCCARVLRGDRATLHRLRAAGFVCGMGFWAFGLPALHRYLCGDGQGDYRGWLRQLYASDLNIRLRELGGEIVILDNRGKVDASGYCLRRLPTQET